MVGQENVVVQDEDRRVLTFSPNLNLTYPGGNLTSDTSAGCRTADGHTAGVKNFLLKAFFGVGIDLLDFYNEPLTVNTDIIVRCLFPFFRLGGDRLKH